MNSFLETPLYVQKNYQSSNHHLLAWVQPSYYFEATIDPPFLQLSFVLPSQQLIVQVHLFWGLERTQTWALVLEFLVAIHHQSHMMIRSNLVFVVSDFRRFSMSAYHQALQQFFNLPWQLWIDRGHPRWVWSRDRKVCLMEVVVAIRHHCRNCWSHLWSFVYQSPFHF